VALMTDVSHHHLATQQIRDSEERMRKFAAITTEAIVLHRDGSSRTAMTHWPGWLATRWRAARHAGSRLRGPEARLRALQNMRSEREDRLESVIIHKTASSSPSR
jgi:hypothetical protein